MPGSIYSTSKGATPFARPQFSLVLPEDAPHDAIRTVPDLVEHNAVHNPDHLFCLQYNHNSAVPPRRITMRELQAAVLQCSAWLAAQGIGRAPMRDPASGGLVKAKPVALLMASDVGWFIQFVALLRIGVPVLCMSARLAPPAVVHLAKKTGAQTVLVTPQLAALAAESAALFASDPEGAVSPAFVEVPAYSAFLDSDFGAAPAKNTLVDPKDRNVVILHSSGTTGLPKPIYHPHAYLLGYATCHRLSEADVAGGMNVSTLPLFHGFGLLAPSMSLSIGLPFAIPAATTIPTGTSTAEVLKSARATCLMTVPSILEEIYQLDERGIAALKPLRFVAVGGAPMKLSVAEPLAAAGVKILNHWGVTELGAIAPIVVPEPTYDWHYLRLRSDLDLRIEPHPDSPQHFRLVGRPLGGAPGEEFIVQDLLTVNPEHPTTDFRILGRADDLVVLATGEKVRPTGLEQAVSEDPRVRGAVAIGEGRFQLGLLVEAAPHVQLDPTDSAAVREYVESIWAAVERGNARSDAHARVTREMVLVTTPAYRALARTPKGSIPRNENAALFAAEVEALYARRTWRTRRCCLWGGGGVEGGGGEDGPGRVHDSARATMLRRRLVASVARTEEEAGVDQGKRWKVPADIVYANPTIERITAVLRARLTGNAEGAKKDRAQRIGEVVAEYAERVAGLRGTSKMNGVGSSAGAKPVVVLLTGSTGSLGSAMLADLALNPCVQKVYGLNRKSGEDVRKRQAGGFARVGAEVDAHWRKIELLEGDLSKAHFGLEDEVYAKLRDVTHVIHNAWPMDFNRSLTSFRPHLDAAVNVVQLALDSTTAAPVRIVFSSSIAVVGRAPLVTGDTAPITEAPLLTVDAIDHFGYAEAKWVCEQVFAEAGRVFEGRVAPSSVRIGQLTGPEATGAWNANEHVPMIVKSALALGRLPLVEGTASWIPANRASRVMVELLFAPRPACVYHLENPARQPWSEALEVLAAALGLPAEAAPLPYAEWLARVRADTDTVRNPAGKIVPFLEDEFVRMATGWVVLDTAVARGASPTLEGSKPLSEGDLRRYVAFWRSEGFLA
ncbi:L-aminoadipate-semialdehyde dehydrogenase [Grifola frondosa]|uniref:L-aminoadipate-semialdehyde dehydrogenase n=1 Tax=Grifola frondosa TaxID=5627 RepID=A0A1C7LMN1_GRIFR|nr:L-aminoadipate-semialdehyde dehydrogenase [Grifola frondosa]